MKSAPLLVAAVALLVAACGERPAPAGPPTPKTEARRAAAVPPSPMPLSTRSAA